MTIRSRSAICKKTIIEYLTDHVTAKTPELSQLLGVKNTRIKNLIQALIAQDIVVAEVLIRIEHTD